jgi:hypothetical protein
MEGLVLPDKQLISEIGDTIQSLYLCSFDSSYGPYYYVNSPPRNNHYYDSPTSSDDDNNDDDEEEAPNPERVLTEVDYWPLY